MQTILVGSEFVTEDLDRDLTAEFHVFGKIDYTHPARTELFENPVMRNLFRVHPWFLYGLRVSLFQKARSDPAGPLNIVTETADRKSQMIKPATNGERSNIPSGG